MNADSHFGEFKPPELAKNTRHTVWVPVGPCQRHKEAAVHIAVTRAREWFVAAQFASSVFCVVDVGRTIVPLENRVKWVSELCVLRL